MRWLFLILTMGACGGSEDVAVDAEFDVTITNVLEQCHIKDSQPTDLRLALTEIWIDDSDVDTFCGCTDEDGSDCSDDVDRNTETYTYGLIQSGDSISILLDGEEFAQGTLSSCELQYESPVWLETLQGGDVQWKVEVDVALVDLNGTCKTVFTGEADAYDFLGIEKVTIVGSDNPKYPIGRTAWKVISGQRKGG